MWSTSSSPFILWLFWRVIALIRQSLKLYLLHLNIDLVSHPVNSKEVVQIQPFLFPSKNWDISFLGRFLWSICPMWLNYCKFFWMWIFSIFARAAYLKDLLSSFSIHLFNGISIFVGHLISKKEEQCDNTPPADPHYLNHPNYSSLMVFLISSQGYFTFLYGHTTHNLNNREGGRKEEQTIRGLG